MPIRSHVDLCLFVRFVHVRRHQIPTEILDVLLNANSRDTDTLSTAWIRQMSATVPVTFHETYHFWQGLRLPFLYRYAVLSFIEVIQAFKHFSQTVSNLHDWDGIIPDFYRLSFEDKIFGTPGNGLIWGCSTAEPPNTNSPPLLLSPLDLLEGATSLAEFQVLSPKDSRIDPKAFSRWKKLNPAYTKALKWVMQSLNNESLALRCFIPAVNAAFHTTEPVRAFVLLIAELWTVLNYTTDLDPFIAQPEPSGWDEIFQMFLNDRIKFQANPDSDARILGSPFHRLTLQNWVFTQSAFEHPFLTQPAREWCQRERTDPVLSWLLNAPGWAGQQLDDCIVEFAPTLSFIRFYIDQERSRVIATGTPPKSVPLWIEILTMYSVIRRATGAHFDGDMRLCHHRECPEYAPNYCNCFPKIPNNYLDCNFLFHFNELRNRFS